MDIYFGEALFLPRWMMCCCVQWAVGLTTVMTHTEIVTLKDPLYGSHLPTGLK